MLWIYLNPPVPVMRASKSFLAASTTFFNFTNDWCAVAKRLWASPWPPVHSGFNIIPTGTGHSDLKLGKDWSDWTQVTNISSHHPRQPSTGRKSSARLCGLSCFVHTKQSWERWRSKAGFYATAVKRGETSPDNWATRRHPSRRR